MGGGPTSFSRLLRQLRSAASLSQEELAERAGLSVRGVSDLERGLRQAPRPETVRMLANALALSEDDRTALLTAARPDLLQGGHGAPEQSRLVSLPVPLTRLIGRQDELAALQGMCTSGDGRLVTITGPGGTGKTRLAVEGAATMLDRYIDGVVFVDLSPLTDPDLVIPTIAAALGVHEEAGRPLLDTLTGVLAPKRLLLVLDNCERVLAAAPEIAALVSGSPRVTMLTTSREPLRVRGEREFPLLPLPLPAADHQATHAELVANPAMTLFLERATAAMPDFALTPVNASSVAAICQRLDGLPLAIELAAPRVKVLSPTAMLARLDQRLTLLTGGGRDLPERQRTMRDTVAWSYDLLSPDEQTLFRHLAVFAGGFTLEAADVVARPAAHERLPILDGITALVEQSLVRQTAATDDHPRYLMLETVREFGLERLAASGEEADVRRRHAAHFLQLSDSLQHRVQMFMNLETLRHVAAEHDNLRLALAWLDEQDEIDALLRLSASLYALWFARGLYNEGSQWVERALARAGEQEFDARVQALVAAGMLAIFQGAYDRAEVLLDQGLQQARALNDPSLISESLIYTSLLDYRRGEYRQAAGVLDEAHTLLSGLDDYERGAMPSQLAGDIALAQEHFDLAAAQYEESLARFRATENTWQLIDAQAGLAGVRFCTGHLNSATVLYADCLQRSQQLNFKLLVVTSLIGLSAVAAAVGRTVTSAQLLGAAETLAASLGTPIFPRDLPVHERACTTATMVLGDEAFAEARESGWRMSIHEGIAEAQRVANAVAATGTAECG